MTRVYVYRCDACRKQADLGDPELGNWYQVDRNNPREFNEAGDSDRFDFCSLPCLASWASAREIVRTAS